MKESGVKGIFFGLSVIPYEGIILVLGLDLFFVIMVVIGQEKLYYAETIPVIGSSLWNY